ncbi:hypothetical protein PISMIDRAFT_17445 [Pisolithus microcarpus 441]|uniref:Uncharacterized protein n=1 Tax=Pisolithus microcarpus 441 TaxID=765257 RepID=A0A0C9XPC8_9AGAM|nr:hypothetical protein BKA83DRAFT_17445 [Pisolithus microcarpus]KIK14240.1 hypothetical protein PISMIDRAFT_17445 [Pisolithus microcarpus 441]
MDVIAFRIDDFRHTKEPAPVDGVTHGGMWWAKGTIVLMCKVDSFLAGTQRLKGVFTTSVQREAMKDLTLSDGSTEPKGTRPSVPTYIFHSVQFSQLYDMGAKVLDIRRRHPRKFLAPDELKTMLAHILMSYNVEFETEPPGQQAFTGNLNVIADPADSRVKLAEEPPNEMKNLLG